MDKTEILRLMSKFEKARHNLLLVIVFTAINLILIAVEANYYFLFSATAPLLSYGIGWDLSYELLSNEYLIAGIVVAVIIILLYAAFWLFAKRRRAFILAAFILFLIDSLIYGLLLADVLLADEFVFTELLDIAFHIWILIALFSGIIAWRKLRGVNTDEIANESLDLSTVKRTEEQ